MKDPKNILRNWRESSLSFDQNLRLKISYLERLILYMTVSEKPSRCCFAVKIGWLFYKVPQVVILDRIVRSVFI